MPKTKLKNETKSVVTLKEGQAGILRRICELKHGGYHNVVYDVNQTYKEYWCIGNGTEFQLSSDDLLEWKEIEIRPTDADPEQFCWEGTIPWKKGTFSGTTPASSTTLASSTIPGSSTTPPHSSFLSKFLPNKTLGWFSNQKPQGTVITTTIFTDPATASNTATVPAPTDAATPAATTTVTITSTTPLATTTPSTTTP